MGIKWLGRLLTDLAMPIGSEQRFLNAEDVCKEEQRKKASPEKAPEQDDFSCIFTGFCIEVKSHLVEIDPGRESSEELAGRLLDILLTWYYKRRANVCINQFRDICWEFIRDMKRTSVNKANIAEEWYNNLGVQLEAYMSYILRKASEKIPECSNAFKSHSPSRVVLHVDNGE